MTTTIVYGCKRRFFAALQAEVAPGRMLDGVPVHYAYPGEAASDTYVYGGGVRETQTDDAADGTDVLKYCVASLTLYVTVLLDPGEGVAEAADAECERIGDVIGGWMARHPDAAAPGTRATMTFMSGDYSQDRDRHKATAGFNIEVRGYLKP